MSTSYPSQPRVDDELVFDPIVFSDGFRRHKRRILKIASLLVIVTCSIILLIYKDKYTSESLVYLDRTESPAIVSDSFKTFFEYGDAKINIFKSQIELLTSDLLVKNLFQRLSQRDAQLMKDLDVVEPGDLKRFLKPEYLKETDFIAVRVATENPVASQKLNQYYIDEYISEANNIRTQPFERKRQILEEKIQTIEATLSTKADQLRTFQEEEGVIDVLSEGTTSVKRLEDLRTEVDLLESKIAEREGETEKLRSQLNTDLNKAISSVAKGADPLYTALLTELSDAEKEYKAQSTIYTANHPALKTIKARIDAIKRGLAEQERLSTGKNSRGGLVIRDTVRQEMVGRLSIAETDLMALRRKQAVSLDQLARLEKRLGLLPTKQVKYNEINAEVKNLQEILSQLRNSLAEVKLQQSVEKVYVYSPPTRPEGKNFPTQFHLFVFSLLFLPFLTYLCFVVYEQIRQNRLCNLQELQRNFGVTALTVIPWIGSKKPMSLRLEILSNIYNTFALKLKASRDNHDPNKKIFLLASLFTQTERNFYALQSLALSMAKMNEKVLIIDLNLSHSFLRYQLASQLDLDSSLPALELVERVQAAKTAAAKAKALQTNIYQTDAHSNVYFFDLFESLEDNFEFFNTQGFLALVETLKELDFSWILCDAPPLLKGTETFSLVRKMDGVILLVEKDSHRSQVYDTINHIHQLQGSVAGIALRQSS